MATSSFGFLCGVLLFVVLVLSFFLLFEKSFIESDLLTESAFLCFSCVTFPYPAFWIVNSNIFYCEILFKLLYFFLT